MNKIAILISGHIRNFEEIIKNFKENLINILLENEYDYDIYIHTWDNNLTKDTVLNNDKHYNNNKVIDIKYLEHIFKTNNIKFNKNNCLIENQKNINIENNIDIYIENNITNKTIHNNNDKLYIKGLFNKLFWQYYGHHKTFKLIENIESYNYIIKTRPDLYYDKFDISLLEKNIFFPNSHIHNQTNINQLFFGGKTNIMIKILNYFNNVVYYNNNINNEIIKLYDEKDVNFNKIFRYYIINYLNIKPFYCDYNPKLYRNNKLIINIV